MKKEGALMTTEKTWQPDKEWRMLSSETERKCRYSADRKLCGEKAIAEFRRGKRSNNIWWAYCLQHLYGRTIRNGVIGHKLY